jgi:hypothetical protein
LQVESVHDGSTWHSASAITLPVEKMQRSARRSELRCDITTHSTGLAISWSFINHVDCSPVNSSVRLLLVMMGKKRSE